MNQAGYSWLIFALMTVSCWGLYGVFLHSGQLGMADPVNGRYKAFLFVGIAYFLVAVLAPLAILAVSGAGLALSGAWHDNVLGRRHGRAPSGRSEYCWPSAPRALHPW